MNKFAKKKTLLCAGVLCVGTLLSLLGAVLTLQNLGPILSLFMDTGGDALDFVAIFGQTRDAALSPPWLIALALWLGFAVLLHRLPPRSPRAWLGILLYAVGGVCLLGLSYTLSLLLCEVNGVRFIDLLRALIPMLGSL